MTDLENTPKVAKTGILEKIKAAPKRTKLIAAGVAALVVVSGGVASYAALQTPDAVVAQAIVSLVTTQNPNAGDQRHQLVVL